MCTGISLQCLAFSFANNHWRGADDENINDDDDNNDDYDKDEDVCIYVDNDAEEESAIGYDEIEVNDVWAFKWLLTLHVLVLVSMLMLMLVLVLMLVLFKKGYSFHDHRNIFALLSLL